MKDRLSALLDSEAFQLFEILVNLMAFGGAMFLVLKIIEFVELFVDASNPIVKASEGVIGIMIIMKLYYPSYSSIPLSSFLRKINRVLLAGFGNVSIAFLIISRFSAGNLVISATADAVLYLILMIIPGIILIPELRISPQNDEK